MVRKACTPVNKVGDGHCAHGDGKLLLSLHLVKLLHVHSFEFMSVLAWYVQPHRRTPYAPKHGGARDSSCAFGRAPGCHPPGHGAHRVVAVAPVSGVA